MCNQRNRRRQKSHARDAQEWTRGAQEASLALEMSRCPWGAGAGCPEDVAMKGNPPISFHGGDYLLCVLNPLVMFNFLQPKGW